MFIGKKNTLLKYGIKAKIVSLVIMSFQLHYDTYYIII